MKKPPTKPPGLLGAASVTMPLSVLTGMQQYIAELEKWAESHTECAPETPVQAADALLDDPPQNLHILEVAAEVASFAVAHLHPSMNGMSRWPLMSLRALGRALTDLQPERAAAFAEFARSAEAYNAFRAGQAASWASPCKTCGCPRDGHAVVMRACGACPDERYPDVRKVCGQHPECARFVPSVPLPPQPAL